MSNRYYCLYIGGNTNTVLRIRADSMKGSITEFKSFFIGDEKVGEINVAAMAWWIEEQEEADTPQS